MLNDKYCPLVSLRNASWIKCLGDKCMFYNNKVGRCSIWMIGNSLGFGIVDRELFGNEGRDVKK